MRQKQNMLLAGVAALALLAGGGIAAAQQTPQDQNHTGAAKPGAMQMQSSKPAGAASGMEQHAQTPKNDQAPSLAKQGAATGNAENRSAQNDQKAGQNAKQSAQTSQQLGKNMKGSSEAKQRIGENAEKSTDKTAKTERTNESRERIGAREKTRHERLGANTRSEREHSRISERNERNHTRVSERSGRTNDLKGLQGNASIPMQGSHVNLTSQQRTTIRDSVIDARGAPRVGHVDFDVTVGTVVPRDRVHVVRVPETLVRIDPQWHGYLYFIVEDQVVIVNPRDMRIVAVLDV